MYNVLGKSYTCSNCSKSFDSFELSKVEQYIYENCKNYETDQFYCINCIKPTIVKYMLNRINNNMTNKKGGNKISHKRVSNSSNCNKSKEKTMLNLEVLENVSNDVRKAKSNKTSKILESLVTILEKAQELEKPVTIKTALKVLGKTKSTYGSYIRTLVIKNDDKIYFEKTNGVNVIKLR